MEYAIVEISGRQYLIKPGEAINVDKLPEGKNLVVDKVLAWMEGGKLEVGEPYLKKTLELEVLGDHLESKIRVAKFKSKANSRRVRGQKVILTKVVWEKEKVVKKTSK